MDSNELIEKLGNICPQRITRCIELEPGVFFIEFGRKDRLFANERQGIVLIEPYTGISLSKEALAYKNKAGDFWVSTWKSPIGYELLKSLKEHGISEMTKYQFATESCGAYLDYFGQVPPPPMSTPLGEGYRYISVYPGLYFVESGGEWCLAVSFEIWRHNLSDEAVYEGYSFQEDQKMGMLNARGYAFFRRDECALAIFDLLKSGTYPNLEKYLISSEALYEHLWATHKMYIKNWNDTVMRVTKVAKNNRMDVVNRATAMLVPQWMNSEPRKVEFLRLPGDDQKSCTGTDDFENQEEYIRDLYDGRWGDIEDIEETIPGVYLVNYNEDDLVGHYILTKDYHGGAILGGAMELGCERDGLMYFDKKTGAPIILFEALRSTLTTVDEVEAHELCTDLYCIASLTSESYESYFGEYPVPPRFSPEGEGSRYIKISRGLYFIEGPNTWYLAVGMEAAYSLSQEVKSKAEQVAPKDMVRDRIACEEWIFFDIYNCACPVYEILQEQRFQKDMIRFVKSLPLLERAAAASADSLEQSEKSIMPQDFLRLPGVVDDRPQ